MTPHSLPHDPAASPGARPTSLRVLIVEDRPADAELLVHALRRAGFTPDWQRVDTEAEYLAHLEPVPDVILADYAMPQFTGLEALRLVRQRGLVVPFIMVTGVDGEGFAVTALHEGADDYLLKDRLARLGQAVARALDQHRLREVKRQADQALRDSEQTFFHAFDKAPFAAALSQLPTGVFVAVNEAFEKAFGYTKREAIGKNSLESHINPDTEGRARITAELQTRGSVRDVELMLRTKSGEERVFSVNVDLVEIGGQQYILNTTQDITARVGGPRPSEIDCWSRSGRPGH